MGKYRGSPGNRRDRKIINVDPFTDAEVKAGIKALKKGKATGPDGIPAELLKWLNDTSLDSVTHILNHWWNGSAIPEELTQAEVVSLYKKGDIESAHCISS